MTYRAAVVGCGRIGCSFDDDPKAKMIRTHAGAYSFVPGVELVALVDVELDRARHYAAKFGAANAYRDCAELLRHEGIDILSVCTWSDTHAEIVRAAVEAGVRAIFCEKPMALTLQQADEMLELCRSAGVLLMIDHQRRFDKSHQNAAAFVHGGGLGKIQQATCYYTAGLVNTGTHMVDLLRWFLGEATSMTAYPSSVIPPNPNDPNVNAWIQFVDTVATLQALDVKHYTIFELNLLGEKGRLRILSHGSDFQYEQSVDSPRYSGYRELVSAKLPFAFDPQPQLIVSAVRHLIECLERSEHPVSSGFDGRQALEILCALRESAAREIHVILPFTQTNMRLASR